jgi:hypothetical protein
MTSQLTPKVQYALIEADFEAVITPNGGHAFERFTETCAQITVAPAGPLLVVTVRSRGMVCSHHLNAGELEAHTDEALELMFQTIAKFA